MYHGWAVVTVEGHVVDAAGKSAFACPAFEPGIFVKFVIGGSMLRTPARSDLVDEAIHFSAIHYIGNFAIASNDFWEIRGG
jgi:hypothetical protein